MVHNENQFGSQCEPLNKRNKLIISIYTTLILGQVGPPTRPFFTEGFFVFFSYFKTEGQRANPVSFLFLFSLIRLELQLPTLL
jgi:hypothetical protein